MIQMHYITAGLVVFIVVDELLNHIGKFIRVLRKELLDESYLSLTF